jgi:uncharacterized protein (TIGR00255 family)
MIQSMTGYGRATCDLADKSIVIEIKTLNSKQLDINFRLPLQYRDREMELRNELGNRLKRGKAEVVFSVEFREGKQGIQLNRANIIRYYRQLESISDELGITEPSEALLQSILRLPDALDTDKDSTPADEWEKISLAFGQSLDALEQFRKQEGKALAEDIMNRVNLIENLLSQIEPFEQERTGALRQKLQNSLAEFIPGEMIDKNRFEQELIYYFEKLDITEEKTRLKHHCGYFGEVIKEPEQVGRKLGFVAQEIGREINTIGSKANHSGIQKTVVLMKDELEKVKEQLMNIL